MPSPIPNTGLYNILQALSLDVLLGIFANAIFAVKVLELDINLVWILILLMASWSFYTIDHLIDGYKSKGNSLIYRHNYHYNNRIPLTILSVLSASISIILSLVYLDLRIIYYGLIIGIIVLAYFLMLKFFAQRDSVLIQKELIIAFIYISGIWIAPLVWKSMLIDSIIIYIIILLFLLAWAEGIMASYYDHENDKKDHHISFCLLFGKKNTLIFLRLLLIICLVICSSLVFYSENSLIRYALLIIWLMNVLLISTVVFTRFHSRNEKYRILGELIFCLPILILVADLF